MSFFSTLLLLTLFAGDDSLFQEKEEREDRQHLTYMTPRISYWNLDVRGRVESDQGTSPSSITDGTVLSFDRDLDIDSQTSSFYEIAFLEADSRRNRLYETLTIGFFQEHFTGSSSLEETETFNGRSLASGSDVESSLRLWMFSLDGAVEKSPLGPDTEAEILIGFRIWDVHLSVDTPSAPTSDEAVRLGFLGIGVGFRHRFGSGFGFTLRTGGYISYDFENWFEREWDAVHYDGLLAFTIDLDRLHAELGYRLTAAAADVYRESLSLGVVEHDEWAFSLFGPFASLSFRF